MQEEDQLQRLRNLNLNKKIIEIQHDLENISYHGLSTDPSQQKLPHKKDILQKEQKLQDDDHHEHHGCEHNHNQSKKSSKQSKSRQRQKNFGIIIYCVFTCLSCFYLEVYCFNTLRSNEHERKIKSFFSTLVVFMALWSYFTTITTQNTYIKLKGAPQIIPDSLTDNNFLSRNCQHCKYTKPNRVSHCSTCGACIMKLDHHCIWTQNCIGYRNQKSFYLFTLYMSIGLLQFWQSTYFCFNHLYATCKFFSFFEAGVYILWIITCFSAFIVGIMILTLLFSHTMMILTNHTTLMTMKLRKMCPFPFCEIRDSILEDQSANHYDRGEIQNIRTLFGTNIFIALLPLVREVKHDFLIEPSNPIPSKTQLLELTGGVDAEILRQQELRSKILQVRNLYKGSTFILKGKQIVVD